MLRLFEFIPMSRAIRFTVRKSRVPGAMCLPISDHRQYVEVFGGGASLLFKKEPVEVEVYNDIDAGLVNFFTVLRDPDLFGLFYHYVSMTPRARMDFDTCLATWRAEPDPCMKAYKWFVVNRMSFSGHFGKSWGSSVGSTNRGMAETCSSWLSIIEMLPVIHQRMMRVQIECRDWANILNRYNLHTTLVYVDPPYVPSTRRSGGYEHELTENDHKVLVAGLLEYTGMVILSGYYSDIYVPLENAGWERRDYKTVCHAAGHTRHGGLQGPGSSLKKQPRTESVWRNPLALRNCTGLKKKYSSWELN